MIGDVKFTFFHFDYPIDYKQRFDDIISMLNLLTLGAIKAFALGQRPKWKDYVDLYFILKKHDIGKIADQAKKIFKQEFNEKLFRNQLAYFEDINYSEEVEFMPGFEVDDKIVKKALIEASLS